MSGDANWVTIVRELGHHSCEVKARRKMSMMAHLQLDPKDDISVDINLKFKSSH